MRAAPSPTQGPEPPSELHAGWPGSRERGASRPAHSGLTALAEARGVASENGPWPRPRPLCQMRENTAQLQHLQNVEDSGRKSGAAQRLHARGAPGPPDARGDPGAQDRAVYSLADVGTDGLMSAHPGVSRFLRNQFSGPGVSEAAGGPGQDPGELERRGYAASCMDVQRDHVAFCPPGPPQGALPSIAAGPSGLHSAAMLPSSRHEVPDWVHPVHDARRLHLVDSRVNAGASSGASEEPGQGRENFPVGWVGMAQGSQAARMGGAPAQPACGSTTGSHMADAIGLRSGSHGSGAHARLLVSSQAAEDAGAGAGPLDLRGWSGTEWRGSESMGPAEQPIGAASWDEPIGEVRVPAQRTAMGPRTVDAFPLQRLGASQNPLGTARSSAPALGQGPELSFDFRRSLREEGRGGPDYVVRDNAREQEEGAVNPAWLEAEVWEEQFRGLCLPANPQEGVVWPDSRQPFWQERGDLQRREPDLLPSALHPSTAFHPDQVPMEADILPVEEADSEHISLVSAADLPSLEDFSAFCFPLPAPILCGDDLVSLASFQPFYSSSLRLMN